MATLQLLGDPCTNATLHGQWISVGSGATFPGALSAAMLWQH